MSTAAPESSDARPDLVGELEVIEQQPLAARAAGYQHVLDDLTRRLDAAPGA
ncbi:hypothetical protein [Microbacterium ginsengisoli]|jgi:hypothetical protein|nr:hypothetical protein [Microbacterium ginsengisoli]MBN9209709.1 hypothetical protein [Microbacterium ginsengisoli]